MRILITGGAGFQGVNLAQLLSNKGYEIIILNTFSEKAAQNLKLFGLNTKKVKIIWGSITDKNLMDKTIRDINLVVHMAANIHVDESINEPIKYYEVNVIGTNNILELCRKREISILHISSCEVYGDQENILIESSALTPNSPYASSKVGADVMCYSYYKTFGTKVVIIRPSNVFGPGQKTGLKGAVIPIFVGQALKNQEIYIFGSGNQKREFIYVKDLIKAYSLIINKMLDNMSHDTPNIFGQIFNLGSGNSICIADLANLILKKTNGGTPIFKNPRPGEVGSFYLNSNKLYDFLNWRPKWNIEDGIEEYIGWVKSIGI